MSKPPPMLQLLRRRSIRAGAAGCLCACASLALGAEPEPPEVEPRVLEQVEVDWPEGLDLAPGTVTLEVEVSAEGAVMGVVVVDGPEPLRAAATEAARTLRFEPARRGDVAIPGRAKVYFEFKAEDEDEDALVVEIHADDPDKGDTKARTTLDARAIEGAAGQDLAETVSQIAGVTLARGTADASKPVIRGQVERRLLVLNDGIRHESQKWGPDHATEIDPFSAGKISVIRGAAGAQYGPDAIGGVILVEPPPMPDDPGIHGKALVAFASNGLRPYGALRLDGAPAAVPGLSFRAEGNYGRGASLSAPTYVLGNTASEQLNLGATARYRWDDGQIKASWHHHALRAGVFYGVRNSTPEDFKAQLTASRPVSADLWSTSYDIDKPYQAVTHDTVTVQAVNSGRWGTVESLYAFQSNHRLEYERSREAVTAPQYDFTLRTHSAEVRYLHRAADLGAARLEGRAGLQGTFQENVYEGLPLLPNYRSLGLGVYGAERLAFRRFDLEVAGRYDHLGRTAWLGRADYERHLRRGTLDGERCIENPETQGARCPQAYNTGSATVGGVFHAIPDELDLKVDLSSASRFPNVDELYLIGNAPTFPVYALGSPDLGVETTWGGSATVGWERSWINLEISGFANWVDDYIYFAPELNEEGELHYDVTIRGAWPRYGYRALDAVNYGADGTLRLGPHEVVGLDVRGALVRAHSTESWSQLVGTPPDRLDLTLLGRPRPLGPVKDIELAVTGALVASQSRTDPKEDFAPPPPAYGLLGLRAQCTVAIRERPLHIGLEATNLLNASYREYTSLLRYYADQPGRDVRLRVGFDF